MTLVLAEPPPLENYANPTTSGYIPLPDWYFLFLYQLLKYQFAAGPYILFGILIIPGLAFGALLLAPFLDNGPGRRDRKSTRLNSSHVAISYAVFCLKKKKTQ